MVTLLRESACGLSLIDSLFIGNENARVKGGTGSKVVWFGRGIVVSSVQRVEDRAQGLNHIFGAALAEENEEISFEGVSRSFRLRIKYLERDFQKTQVTCWP